MDRANASWSGDGTSWDEAFGTIQEGIDAANEAGGGEVWVAAGTYDEERGNHSGSVILMPKVRLYGGFTGDGLAEGSFNDLNGLLFNGGTDDDDADYLYFETTLRF